MLMSDLLIKIDDLLDSCRAVSLGEPTVGSFYTIKRQMLRYPDGIERPRDYIDKEPASVVVPVTKEGNFVFVIQPVGLSKSGSLIEFPAGYWNFGEDGMGAGRRELAEETGYTTDKPLIYLEDHYQDPGSIRQTVDAYLAVDCQKTQAQKLDRGEYINYVEIPLPVVEVMMRHNYFTDSNTFIALFKALFELKCITITPLSLP